MEGKNDWVSKHVFECEEKKKEKETGDGWRKRMF